MNIEQLSKSQIVLLTLLISFVTSIATGIVTVSLMDQAPPVIAQTVNRVIERTIETVTPAGQTAGAAVTRERTVVVRETELISQAVANVSQSIVRIYTGSTDSALFLGLGVVLSTDGMIVSDASSLGEATNVSVILSDGMRVRAALISSEKSSGIATLQATSTGTTTVSWKPATIAGGNPILGQTVVALSGKSAVRVDDGIVTALMQAEPTVIDTNISTDSIIGGSPLVNTVGEVIGVSTAVSRASSPRGFIVSSALVKKPESAAQDSEKKAAQ